MQSILIVSRSYDLHWRPLVQDESARDLRYAYVLEFEICLLNCTYTVKLMCAGDHYSRYLLQWSIVRLNYTVSQKKLYFLFLA